MNVAKITRYLTKLRNSDPSEPETFSRLPAVSISFGDTNSVTVKSGQICKRRFIFESTTTTEHREAFFFQRPAMFLKRYFQTRTTVSIT